MRAQKAPKKAYRTPVITRVKLEDRRVVAMAVCKESLDNTACAQNGISPLFDLNPS